MTQIKILVVDDEAKILTMVQNYLTKEGLQVLTARDGETALKLFKQERPHLIVLDWLMPGMSGLDVCREIRKESKVPIIMLTAKAEEVDKLLGLELGADDYITKPFSLRELAARIRAVLRRYQPEESGRENIITIGELSINPDLYEVTVRGKKVPLTPTEFKLLYTLARNRGRVLSRLQLLDAALGEAYEGYERSIDTHISNLRRKLEADPSNPSYIITVYGLGYKMGSGDIKD
ncbi:MAG: hypothetical protein PWP65_1477 [Clostridia bacterium]|nr:hypothetical protein [Clostridia bacterium]